jgi:hypothetical protein
VPLWSCEFISIFVATREKRCNNREFGKRLCKFTTQVCVIVGNTVKLRETSKAHCTKQAWKRAYGQVNCLGYGQNQWDATMDNPQPSPVPRSFIDE